MKKASIFFVIFLFIFSIFLSGCIPSFINPAVEATDKVHAQFWEDEENIQQYDVIVIGGEPEGVAAALSAARNGANTLLIEQRDNLGGLFTYGKMNVLDFPHGIDQQILKSSIFKEWHRMVGNDQSFEIEAAKHAFLNLVYEQDHLSLLLNAEVKQVEMKNEEEIVSMKIVKNDKTYTLQAKTYIDATQNADIAVLSGVPYFIGAEDVGHENRLMAATLMIHLSDVDWKKIKETAKSKMFGDAEVTSQAAWGFSKLREMYQPHDKNMRLRGLNLVRNDEGYFINALQIFGVDGLSPSSIEEGIDRGKKETEYIVQWLQNNFPGFENAKIASFPEELYIRETRHVQSLYQLPVSDLWENKYHWDTIAYGGYPADIQATTTEDAGAVVVNPVQYGIPFRSLVPQKVTNLLVVGRSGGYSSLASGSVRIVATGMATGEGAGAASAVAVKNNMNFHEMATNKEAIREVQQALSLQGTNVEKFTLSYPYEDKWYYPAIRELLNRRALFGGYTNDLLENETVQNKTLSNLLLHIYMAERLDHPNYEENIRYLSTYFTATDLKDLTYEEAKNLIEGIPYPNFAQDYEKQLEQWKNKTTITREDVYIFIGKIFGWI